MTDQPVLRECRLANGLEVTVTDVSRHYYGGYWQMSLEVRCLVLLDAGMFSDPAVASAARRLLGETVPFVRRLERMAVRGDEQETVRQELLERCERHLLPFLGTDHFPVRFIQSEYQQRSKKTGAFFPRLS
jgi:hypothetical protein